MYFTMLYYAEALDFIWNSKLAIYYIPLLTLFLKDLLLPHWTCYTSIHTFRETDNFHFQHLCCSSNSSEFDFCLIKKHRVKVIPICKARTSHLNQLRNFIDVYVLAFHTAKNFTCIEYSGFTVASSIMSCCRLHLGDMGKGHILGIRFSSWKVSRREGVMGEEGFSTQIITDSQVCRVARRKRRIRGEKNCLLHCLGTIYQERFAL